MNFDCNNCCRKMSSFTFSTLCECLENISKLKEKSKKAEELSKVLNRYRKFVSKI